MAAPRCIEKNLSLSVAQMAAMVVAVAMSLLLQIPM
jgi:hypothetical protein